MNFCIKCKHHKEEYAPVAPNRLGKIHGCEHPDYADPVTGMKLICSQVRATPEFCGLEGKGFEEKITETIVEEVNKKLIVEA